MAQDARGFGIAPKPTYREIAPPPTYRVVRDTYRVVGETPSESVGRWQGEAELKAREQAERVMAPQRKGRRRRRATR